MIALSVFYVDSISVGATVAEITWYPFVFTEREFGSGPGKINSLPGEIVENSWNFSPSVSVHHMNSFKNDDALQISGNYR